MADDNTTMTPGDATFLGVAVIAIGLIVCAGGANLDVELVVYGGLVVMGVGGLLLQVGLIAYAVKLGVRAARE